MNGPRRAGVAIIGAGISGLAAAHKLQEASRKTGRPVEMTLFEAAPRAGGVIVSQRRDGFLLEGGPDSILTEKPWAMDLIRRLDLDQHVMGTQDAHARSFVMRHGRLHPTPDGFQLLAPARLLPMATSGLFGPVGLLRMGLDLFIPRRQDRSDESLGDFVRRRLGRQALERLAQPMISAIYGADPYELSVLATFPRFRQMEREHGSLIRALAARRRIRAEAASGARYGLFASLDEGLGLLVERLVERLPQGTLRTGLKVESIREKKAGGFAVAWTGGRPEDQASPGAAAGRASFDAVIIAVPAPAAADLLAPVDAGLGTALARISYSDAATVNLGFSRAAVAHPLDGFGFVVPATESLTLQGCTFVHEKYAGRAPEGFVLLRAFHGSGSAAMTDEGELVETTLKELRPVLGLTGDPRLVEVQRHHPALPLYRVGHLDRVARVEERLQTHPGLALAGNAYRGIGLPDCIRSGEKAAVSVLEGLGNRVT